MKVSVTKAAKSEIAAAADWYGQQGEELAGKFLDSVQQAIERIELNAFGYAKVRGEHRRCMVEKFPYALWFTISGEAAVVACLHAKRSSQLVKERIAGVLEMRKREPS